MDKHQRQISDWLMRCFCILLASLIFSLSLDKGYLASASWLIVNQALFISVIAYLLLPAANSPARLLSNSVTAVILLAIHTQLPGSGMPALAVLLRICIVMFCLSLLLWSLRQLIQSLSRHGLNATTPVLLFAAFIACTPIWLGPLVNLYPSGDSTINSIIAITPLTHFSVAAEYDYLRSDWFYQNTPFGSLPFTYPGLASIVTAYLLLIIVLQIIIWQITRQAMKPDQPQSHSLTIP